MLSLLITGAALVLGVWTSRLIHTWRLSWWLHVPAALAMLGVSALTWLTTARLTRAFDAADNASPADRQALLSDRIASAELPTAVALLVVAAWLLALVIATVRLRRRR